MNSALHVNLALGLKCEYWKVVNGDNSNLVNKICVKAVRKCSRMFNETNNMVEWQQVFCTQGLGIDKLVGSGKQRSLKMHFLNKHILYLDRLLPGDGSGWAVLKPI